MDAATLDRIRSLGAAKAALAYVLGRNSWRGQSWAVAGLLLAGFGLLLSLPWQDKLLVSLSVYAVVFALLSGASETRRAAHVRPDIAFKMWTFLITVALVFAMLSGLVVTWVLVSRATGGSLFGDLLHLMLPSADPLPLGLFLVLALFGAAMWVALGSPRARASTQSPPAAPDAN